MLEDDAIFIDLIMEQIRSVSIDGFVLVFLVQIFIVQQVALIFLHPLCDDGGSMLFPPEQTKATGESRDRGSGK